MSLLNTQTATDRQRDRIPLLVSFRGIHHFTSVLCNQNLSLRTVCVLQDWWRDNPLWRQKESRVSSGARCPVKLFNVAVVLMRCFMCVHSLQPHNAAYRSPANWSFTAFSWGILLEIIFFYLGDVGEMEESHGYNSAVLHSEQEACSERWIIQDKENQKGNVVYSFEP